VLRHVEVQDPATPVLDHEEAVQYPKGRGRHGEEVEGDDGLAMVAQKRKPLLARIASALNPPTHSRQTLEAPDADPLQPGAIDLGVD
jgi:hypothetical protein